MITLLPQGASAIVRESCGYMDIVWVRDFRVAQAVQYSFPLGEARRNIGVAVQAYRHVGQFETCRCTRSHATSQSSNSSSKSQTTMIIGKRSRYTCEESRQVTGKGKKNSENSHTPEPSP